MRFDWTTLALQTVNLLVLIWLLHRFLFRPVTEIIQQRKEAAEKLLSDAAALRDAAQRDAEQVASHEKALVADKERLLAVARSAAEAERAAMLRQAQAEADKTRAAGEAGLAQERARVRRDLEADARRLAVTIASRLLTRVPAEAIGVALLRQLDAWLAAMPPGTLASLTGADGTLEAVTAAPLDAAEQDACAAMLRRYLGPGLAPRFTVDPALLAGVELRGPHGRLGNNWRADLDRIEEELGRDEQPIAMA